MSHRANYWLAQIDPSRVKSGAFRVLFHLCDHHNGETDPKTACFPSQETLKKRTGMSNGALNDALAQLESDGLICRIRSTIPGTSTRRTYYVLECDFANLPELTPVSGVSSNSGEPETAKKLTPVFGGANSGFQGSKLRPTGEEPVSNRKEPSAHVPARGDSIKDAEKRRIKFLNFWSDTIKQGKVVPDTALKARDKEEMIDAGLISLDELRKAGVQI